MPAIIISSIRESAGKSAISSALAAHLIESGASVKVSGGFGTLFHDDQMVTIVEAGEIEASEDAVAIVEGSSGDVSSDLDIAERIDARVVLIVNLEDDIRGTAAQYGDRLAGVVINKVPAYRDVHAARAAEELETMGIRCLASITENRRLSAPTISAIVDKLDGDVLLEGGGLDSLIDNYLIGGLVLDWGPFYFRSQENTCVVVRAGRPDVQIAALQSDTTRALVLTGGQRPIDYVYYEARTKGIPLIVVESDTEETMHLLDDLQKGSFDHEDKLERMKELVSEGTLLSSISELLAAPATR